MAEKALKKNLQKKEAVKSLGRVLMNGNEAIARGAYEAGVVVAASYPGTPGTEILASMARYDDILADWAVNEKTAMEIGIGAAMGGVRTMVSMKQQGINVALDPLINWSHTGTNGAMVVAIADDPGQHSSQTEDDTRMIAKFARVPCLDVYDSQSAKDYVKRAFEISERFDTPVILRTYTRVAHAKSIVDISPRVEQKPKGFIRNPQKWVVVPGNAVKRETVVIQRLEELKNFAEETDLNVIEWGSKDVGFVTSGAAYQYVKYVMPEASIFRLGLSFPTPAKRLRDFASQVDKLVVLEETRPFFEEEMKIAGISKEIIGRSRFLKQGELNPFIVHKGLIGAGIKPKRPVPVVGEPEQGLLRPPLMCAGCPHRAVYYALKKLDYHSLGDIGCYTLSVLPPLASMHTAICMGASIGNAVGLAKAGTSEKPIVATIGDSTFLHSGITPLLDAVYNQANIVVIIMDNRATAMTGGQGHVACGRTAKGGQTVAVDFEDLVRGLGVKWIRKIDNYNVKRTRAAIEEAVEYPGPAVIVNTRPCALMPKRITSTPYGVNEEKCVGCHECMNVGCPAITVTERLTKKGKEIVHIDELVCTGCSVCAQICPSKAIQLTE
jgi:indolepyruvate ferredoxin oxidoreductase alpha subunit